VLAVDGSRIALPRNPDTEATFGIHTIRTQHIVEPEYQCFGRASVLYDVLNRVALDAVLTRGDSSEVALAIEHMDHVRLNDLVLYDRGYAGYRLLAEASQHPGDFLVRCGSNSFATARKMLAGGGKSDVIKQVRPSDKVKRELREVGSSLPTKLTVRFVRITLKTGEYEVLATSLLDQARYPLDIFEELYWQRWGVETFYGVLKTRLGLENFSGHSAEAILQDFHATVFLTGMESMLTQDANEQLAGLAGKHPRKVNKAVSFNAIKTRAFDLLLSDRSQDEVLKELTELFLTNPVSSRPDRNPPRGRATHTRSLRFWKNMKKIVF